MSVNNEDLLPLDLVQTPSNGVPNTRRFENTGEVELAVSAAVDSDENTAEALARLILGARSIGGGGGDGDGGEVGAKYVKEIKRHKWVAALMAMLLGPGGALAVVYATSDRSKANEAKAKSHDAYGPRITKTEAAVAEIQGDIAKIETSVASAKTQQTKILSGIGELKQENIERVEDELADTKRLLRKAERELER